MKIITVSDTHGMHRQVKNLPKGDVLIHAGDITSRGTKKEVEDFLDWFNNLKQFTHKIFIAGNHDFFLDHAENSEVSKLVPENVIYLRDSGVEIEGVKFWGSPITPKFYNWAFQRERGSAIKQHWDLIPNDIDVLIVHGPPANILDKITNGRNVGCKELHNACQRIMPQFFVCGHIHEDYGKCLDHGTTYVNTSLLNDKYELANMPFELNCH